MGNIVVHDELEIAIYREIVFSILNGYNIITCS